MGVQFMRAHRVKKLEGSAMRFFRDRGYRSVILLFPEQPPGMERQGEVGIEIQFDLVDTDRADQFLGYRIGTVEGGELSLCGVHENGGWDLYIGTVLELKDRLKTRYREFAATLQRA